MVRVVGSVFVCVTLAVALPVCVDSMLHVTVSLRLDSVGEKLREPVLLAVVDSEGLGRCVGVGVGGGVVVFVYVGDGVGGGVMVAVVVGSSVPVDVGRRETVLVTPREAVNVVVAVLRTPTVSVMGIVVVTVVELLALDVGVGVGGGVIVVVTVLLALGVAESSCDAEVLEDCEAVHSGDADLVGIGVCVTVRDPLPREDDAVNAWLVDEEAVRVVDTAGDSVDVAEEEGLSVEKESVRLDECVRVLYIAEIEGCNVSEWLTTVETVRDSDEVSVWDADAPSWDAVGVMVVVTLTVMVAEVEKDCCVTVRLSVGVVVMVEDMLIMEGVPDVVAERSADGLRFVLLSLDEYVGVGVRVTVAVSVSVTLVDTSGVDVGNDEEGLTVNVGLSVDDGELRATVGEPLASDVGLGQLRDGDAVALGVEVRAERLIVHGVTVRLRLYVGVLDRVSRERDFVGREGDIEVVGVGVTCGVSDEVFVGDDEPDGECESDGESDWVGVAEICGELVSDWVLAD